MSDWFPERSSGEREIIPVLPVYTTIIMDTRCAPLIYVEMGRARYNAVESSSMGGLV
ncbi:hypothetical protein [Pasteuria penetrans]|uniref:hypothetical protein n=1 Tax=Pasteuria penetrans TaxID=86005 RepID=UPI00165B72C3|nr:hypothetical protein [Pasteuria penetrans]